MCEAGLEDTPGNVGSRGLDCEAQRRRGNFIVGDGEREGDKSLHHHMLHSSTKALCLPALAWLRLYPLTEDKEDSTEPQLSDTSCAAMLLLKCSRPSQTLNRT